MSTYSPSLRIELITTGDQAGVWGTTTNTNLGGLVESAIAGYTSVSITTANQALTALNGAPDESRNQTIALTTTTTAAFAVYAPPAEKTYVIYNASSYAATIYNSTVIGNTTAAGTGVVVPAGKTVTIWSDGTNFALQNTSVPTPSLVSNDTTIANTAFVQAVATAALQGLHPVGSIYLNATNATNPGTLLGFGTWAAFGAGRVPVGFDAGNALFNTAEETGGSYDATLVSHDHTYSSTTAGSGAHSHSINDPGHVHALTSSTGGGIFPGLISVAATTNTNTQSSATGISVNGVGDHAHSFSGTTSGSGSGATNANIQPYITVYMWKRTA
jgi:hypothetical protein